MSRMCLWLSIIVFTAGCDSSEPVSVTIHPDERIRQISAVNYSSLLASVSFNSGVEQEVRFSDSNPRTVAFTTINRGTFNDYEITWIEEIDGVRLIIASQSGQFLADSGGSGTILGSNYNFAYDNNRDGVTNLTERESGSCPWFKCDDLGGLIDPQEVTEISSNTANFILSKTGPREWLETIDTSGPHSWVVSGYTRASIFLIDSERNFEFEVDLSSGLVRIKESPEGNFRPLYTIAGVQ